MPVILRPERLQYEGHESKASLGIQQDFVFKKGKENKAQTKKHRMDNNEIEATYFNACILVFVPTSFALLILVRNVCSSMVSANSARHTAW